MENQMRLTQIIFSLVFAITLFTSNTFAADPKPINFVPSVLYTPTGFDSNDSVQFMLEGDYPTSCYKMGQLRTQVDKEAKKIYVTNEAYHFYDVGFEPICIQALVPYQRRANLGIIDVPGNYDVMFAKNEDLRTSYVKMGSLPITSAVSAAPDEEHYAPVSKVTFETDDYGIAVPVAKLSGVFTNSCMAIDEVKVIHVADSNTIDILPIMKNMDGDDCTPIPAKAFKHAVDLSNYPSGRRMIHVRSLNGQAIFEIVNL